LREWREYSGHDDDDDAATSKPQGPGFIKEIIKHIRMLEMNSISIVMQLFMIGPIKHFGD
jgi:hypothetical protein